MLYGFMDPLSERFFGVYDEMHWVEVRDVFRKAFGIESFQEKASGSGHSGGSVRMDRRTFRKRYCKIPRNHRRPGGRQAAH
jgi:hypothetical protein